MEKKLAIKLRKFNRICPIAGYKEESIKVGAQVIVLTDRGEECGSIVAFSHKYPKMTASDVRLKKVIRYATEEDINIIRDLPRMDNEALVRAAEKIKEFELIIKLIDVEYLFDTKKVNIYYKVQKDKHTPDLKAFRKDLGMSLQAEVTMRSLTPRDEAKIYSGLGPCGRALCCASWLEKPRHITVKMVKEAGFSISPTRTSGICGRLMCCFGYDKEEGGRT